MKLLFLSRWYPYPADNGAKLRIFNVIKELAREHEVSLVSFTDKPVTVGQMQAMHEWCTNVQTASYKVYEPGSMKSKLGMLSWKPRSVVSTDSAEMHALARSEANRLKPDLVLASQIDMIPYARDLEARRMIEELEVGIIRQASQDAQGGRKLRAMMTWMKLRAYVRSVSRTFHGCTVVSENEFRLVRQMTSEMALAIMPNGVDVEACQRVREEPVPDTIIYNGSLTYGPNLEAMQYFVQQIFPLVLRERPSARLFITGATKGVPVNQLPKHDRVELTGYVDDIRTRVAKCWLAIAPIRRGGGTRLKILEAMALRTPVVCTSKGAEGLNLIDGEDALFADDPQLFARHVVGVLSDASLRAKLSAGALQTVSDRFDWRVIGRELSQFACRVAG